MLVGRARRLGQPRVAASTAPPAAADLPDIIVRFDPQNPAGVAQRIAALPDLAALHVADRRSPTSASRRAASSRGNGVGRGRRARPPRLRDRRRPRPRRAAGEVVIERGLAAAWGIELGGTLDDRRARHAARRRLLREPRQRLLSARRAPRLHLAGRAGRLGLRLDPQVNLAEIWLRDPRYLDEVLVQARATSYGLHDLRFVTRSGVRVLLDQAAGIVIDLLVALSLIALATAGVMLAASARAEVQRRLGAIGVRRAVGASRGHLAGHAGARGAVRRRAGGHARRDRRARSRRTARPAGCSCCSTSPPPGAALVARARGGVAGERRDPGARGGLAGLARGRPAAGGAAARRRARAAARRPARLAHRGAGLDRARRPPRRRPPHPPDRHGRRRSGSRPGSCC